jgi:hypothetical protein
MNFSLGKRAGIRYLRETILLFAAGGMDVVGLGKTLAAKN